MSQTNLGTSMRASFSDDDYVSRAAKNVQEPCQLVEAGFEYVADMDGVKVFLKCK